LTVSSFPTLQQVVLDSTDARGLAEFYRELLGYAYRAGDEAPPAGEDDARGRDWLVLIHPSGAPRIAFQQVAELPASTWPGTGTPQQLHLDLTVGDEPALRAQHERALALGASLLLDRSDDPAEQLFVYADPDGHPFCIFVAPA
jgi:catechol 2,3-dioxygenase-like lactoylglutathione lyase family enzyme